MTLAAAEQRVPERRRRKTLKAYNVLGDLAQYEATLEALGKPREPTPPAETFDMSCVPGDILEAMNTDRAVYQPILEAFKGLLAERSALADEHARVLAQNQATSMPTEQSQSVEMLAATRDSRVLAKHRTLEEKWAVQAVTLASKYGKQPGDTALARAFTFRKRREKLDHIHKSKPVHERIGNDVFWQISLREAYSRYLRVGHEFSGLYVDAEEKPPQQMRVPLEIFGKPLAFDPTRGPVAEALVEQLGLRRRRLLRSQEEKGRAWLQGSYLQSIERKYRRPMAKMMPHNPNTDHLAVVGTSATDALAAQAARPIALREVLARLAETHPAAAEAYAAAAAQRKQRQAEEAAAALQEAEEALQAQRAAAVPTGVALRFAAERLVVRCEVGKTAHATLRVRSTGSAAVRFHWTASTCTPPVAGAAARAAAEEVQGSPFLMCRREGAILPGQDIEFEFVFRPQRAGMFTESWTMAVQPALTSDLPQPPPVTIRGVAFEHDCNSLRRSRLRRGLLQSQSRREAAAALDRILIGLTARDCGIPQLPEDVQAEHAAFAAAVVAEEPPLFFRRGLGERLRAVDVRVRELVEEMGEGAGGKGKKVVLPEAVVRAVEEHQGALASLQSLVAAVAEHAPNESITDAAGVLAEELRAIRADAAVPDEVTVLHAHVVRQVVLAAADACDAAAAAALKSAIASLERRRAAEAEAAALEEQPSVAASAPPPTPGSGKGGKGGKGATEAAKPSEPPEAEYDPAVYQDLLQRGMRECVRSALNGFEDTLAHTLEHVGGVLDARIADAQRAAPPACGNAGPAPADDVPPADAAEEAASGVEDAGERRAWAVFTLLRQRAALGVPSAPPRVLEPAAPLRRPVLDFGMRVSGLREQQPATAEGGGCEGAVLGEAEHGSRGGSGSGMHAVGSEVGSPTGEQAEAGDSASGVYGEVVDPGAELP